MGTYLNPTLSSRMTRTLTPFLIFQRKLQNLRADEGLGPRFSRRKEPSPDRIGSTVKRRSRGIGSAMPRVATHPRIRSSRTSLGRTRPGRKNPPRLAAPAMTSNLGAI